MMSGSDVDIQQIMIPGLTPCEGVGAKSNKYVGDPQRLRKSRSVKY